MLHVAKQRAVQKGGARKLRPVLHEQRHVSQAIEAYG